MGLLARASVLILVGASACYAPELRDCTVKCVTETDCAGNQVCSSGYCVGASDVVCSSSNVANDAGTGGGGGGGGGGGTGMDAGQVVMVDAGLDAAPDAPPDAPTHGTLTVTIAGRGGVLVQGIGLCSHMGQPCSYAVPLGVTLTARAFDDDDFEFDRWTTPSVCPDDETSTCSFVPQLATELGVKFKKD